jgi:broad specificity phosphatase PhoE
MIDPLSSTSIIFVRHGEVHNPEAIYYGRLPRFGLSENGRRQAQAAAEELRNKPLAAIYTSPMLRSRQTARIIQSLHPSIPLHTSNLLQEVYTPFDGMTQLELLARDWDLYTNTPGHYETPQGVLARVQKFIGRTRKRHAGKCTVAVTHGDVICFLLLWLDCKPVGVESRVYIPAICITDDYPAHASFVEVVYKTTSPDEMPEFTYVKPYE